MTPSGIVLVIAMGFSPSGATGTSMELLEYSQPTMQACETEAARLNELDDGRFKRHAFCVKTRGSE